MENLLYWLIFYCIASTCLLVDSYITNFKLKKENNRMLDSFLDFYLKE